MYLTSVGDWSFGLKGGLICLDRIISQSTPVNHECLLSSKPSSGPPPSLFSGSATNSFYNLILIELLTWRRSLHWGLMCSGIDILQALIFSNSSSLLPFYKVKGGCPVNISYMMQPTLHQSTALPWPFLSQISGARYSGVPHKVLASWFVLIFSFDSPKSVSLAYPSLSIRTFSGFRL